jgi:hypothetical protein
LAPVPYIGCVCDRDFLRNFWEDVAHFLGRSCAS